MSEIKIATKKIKKEKAKEKIAVVEVKSQGMIIQRILRLMV